MARILGQFGTDTAPYVLRGAPGPREEPGTRVLRGRGWALAGGRADSRDGVAAVLAGAGTLDVRLPLLSRIEAGGRPVAERNHAALLRAAFETDGAGFAEHLRGAYAAAVVDARGTPVLVLAADAAGAVPLYYHWNTTREVLSFATEIPALLALLPDPPTLWTPGLDAYLTAGAALGGATLFEGVRVLPPGTTAVCERGHAPRLLRREPEGTPRVPGPGSPDRELLGEVPGGPGTPSPEAGEGPGAEPDRRSDPLSDPLDRRRARDLPALLPALLWRLGQPEADPGALTAYAGHRPAGPDAPVPPTDPATDHAVDLTVDTDAGRRRVAAAVGDPAEDWLARYVDGLAPVGTESRSRLYSVDYRAYLAERGDAAQAVAARLGEATALRSRRAVLTAFEREELLPVRGLRRTAHLGGAGVRVPGDARRRVSDLLVPGGALTDLVRELLSPARLRASGLLSWRAVERLLAAQLTRPSERLAGTIWALSMFELWREEYAVAVRRPVPPPVRAKSPAELPVLGRRTVSL
ncbi:hypothetical protein [Streptomyces sp. NPDC046374]|uniref:hypothetical protein n=1 Tax=unclassified Streptomyces TaxID=2593676 RepID=UPI0033F75D99